ncbi:hypothetical protein LP415_19280 [Polaromonas sp. P1(28)-8]|nr:hypothetical protein LP415_19280 [Polaromonas sp. P1(28)-8]
MTLALRTASKLINKYPKKSAEVRRQKLFEALNSYFSDCDIGALVEAQKMLQLAEDGYRQLVVQLAASPSANLDGATKVHAVIALATHELGRLRHHAHAAFQKNQKFGQRLEVAPGREVDVDAVIEKCASAVAMTLQMEAHKNKWVDDKGVFVLPHRSAPSEQDIEHGRDVLEAAILWDRWQHTEQRARFHGGKLTRQFDDATPPNVIVTHKPNLEAEKDLIIAGDRLNLRMTQVQLQLIATMRRDFGSDSLEPWSKALTKGMSVFSVDEAIAMDSLSKLLSVDAWEHETEYFGLRLKTIVRGYAALMHFAGTAAHIDSFTKSRAGWEHFFAKYSLTAEQARRFIAATTFQNSSADLFDHPFIQLDNGRLTLLALILGAAVISRIVLSSLASARVDLHGKGKSFERSTAAVFKKADIDCFTVKKTIAGEVYECDVVVPWGDYLFIIECKNNNLPFGAPGSTHYFQEKCVENIEQIHRLLRGFESHPELLADKVADLDKKKIVPVLLNCLPYSRQGRHDGVYFYDSQSLERFLSSGVVSMTNGLNDNVFPGYPQTRIWSGKQPSPDDFMRQLESPFSREYLSKLMKPTISDYPFGPNWQVRDTDLVLEGFENLVHIKD